MRKYQLFIFAFFSLLSCRKSSKVDNLQSSQIVSHLTSIGGGIIREEIAKTDSKDQTIDYNSIITKIKNLNGVVDVSQGGTGIDIETQDHQYLSFILNSKNDTHFVSNQTNSKPNVGQTSFNTTNANQTSVSNPGNKKALIIHPFDAEIFGGVGGVKTALTMAGYTITEFDWQNSTLDKFSGDFLTEFGVIYISTHGKTGIKMADGSNNTAILTRELYDETKIKNVPDGYLRGMNTPTDNSIAYFGVTESYLKYTLTKKFPNSLVYIDACESMTSHGLANFFLENGAQAFIGNYQTSFAIYTVPIADLIFAYMCDGYSISQAVAFSKDNPAFSNTVKFHGEIYAENTIAYLRQDNITLNSAPEIISSFSPVSGPDGTLVNIKLTFPDTAKVRKGNLIYCCDINFSQNPFKYTKIKEKLIIEYGYYVHYGNADGFYPRSVFHSVDLLKGKSDYYNSWGGICLPFIVTKH